LKHLKAQVKQAPEPERKKGLSMAEGEGSTKHDDGTNLYSFDCRT